MSSFILAAIFAVGMGLLLANSAVRIKDWFVAIPYSMPVKLGATMLLLLTAWGMAVAADAVMGYAQHLKVYRLRHEILMALPCVSAIQTTLVLAILSSLTLSGFHMASLIAKPDGMARLESVVGQYTLRMAACWSATAVAAIVYFPLLQFWVGGGPVFFVLAFCGGSALCTLNCLSFYKFWSHVALEAEQCVESC